MSEIDPDDDSVARWVIYHYRFDDERNERRNVAVAAFGTEAEFRGEFVRLAERIRVEVAAGTRDAQENLSGMQLSPGHVAAQARGHLIRRAIEHGVNPFPILAGVGELPGGMAILSADDQETGAEGGT